jgi:phage protein U
MYQLGDIQFEGLRGLDSLSKTREAVYAELPLMSGKPRLQRTGTALQTVSVSVSLHAAFTDPAADIAALDAYREAGEVLPLITGEGEVVGDFVIISIEETVTQTTPTGRTISAQVTMSLKEYNDPNKSVTLAQAAQSAAFAVGADKVVPVRLVRPPVTEMSVTSQQVEAGNAASRDSIATLRKAPLNTPQQASLLVRAKKVLEAAEAAYKSAKDAVSASANLAAKAPQLSAQLDGVLAVVTTLAAQIASGNVANALTAADALEAALPGLADAVRPLNAILMTRQPQ